MPFLEFLKSALGMATVSVISVRKDSRDGGAKLRGQIFVQVDLEHLSFLEQGGPFISPSGARDFPPRGRMDRGGSSSLG